MEVGEFDVGQLSLNLPHCAASQTDIEASYPCIVGKHNSFSYHILYMMYCLYC
jgi:hypothetical protein